VHVLTNTKSVKPFSSRLDNRCDFLVCVMSLRACGLASTDWMLVNCAVERVCKEVGVA
jgi:hypothetical protein